tara:strand:- start:764 stop:1084 length:321 start_codon:yes stop_codon:yes gene_type:complete
MAHRGIQWIYLMQQERNVVYLPGWANSEWGHLFVQLSMLLLILLGFVNGFLLDGFKGMLIVGITTFLGASVLHFVLFSWINILHPLAQFYLLWPAYFIYTVYKLFV